MPRCLWSLPVAVPFFISRSAASTSHDVISGTSFGSVCVKVFFSLSYSSVYNSSIRSMILSWSRICLPCLSRSATNLSWPSFCFLRTFFDAIIVSRMISSLSFLLSSLAFVLMVLNIFELCLFFQRFPPFLVVSSSGLVFVMISTISVVC